MYSPAAGTVLSQGPHLLNVTFTPTDTVDYVPTTVTVAITVSGGTSTYDTGTVAFLANGTPLGTAVSYGQNSTPATVAAALATAVNGASGTPVKLTAVDNTLYITALTAGAGGDSITYQVKNTAYNPVFSGPSFPSGTISGTLEGGAASGTDAGKLVYSYNDGYDGVGNMTSSTDSVIGNWTYTPDTLNRLVGATNVPVPVATSPTSYYCWSYDAFGNRNLQGVSSKTFASPAPACTPQDSATYQGVWAHYAAGNNRFSNTQQAIGGVSYDGAGNILNDGVNQYLYDGDGRICAVSSSGTGEPVLTGYIYDAEGERVSKGSITAWSCDPGVNGFKPLSDYVLGLSGEQVTEMGMNPSGSMAWQHTNVYAFGQVTATYDNDGLHFYLNDPLGTRRAQTDYAGVLEQTCTSLPFGDALSCGISTQSPSEHHFTGKERDAESGNDYFGARYYASTMGRFMSPDWSATPTSIPYASLPYPQSLNLYNYVQNNPLSRTDPNGHCDVDGEHHGGFWCAAHALGFVETNMEYTARMDWAMKHPFTPTQSAALQGENTAVSIIMIGMAASGGQAAIDEELASAEATAAQAAEDAGDAGTGAARTMLNGVPQPIAAGETVVGPGGTAVHIPAGYVAEPAANGNGIVYRPAGSTGDANTIRVMGPDAQVRYPQGYVRIYNSVGQPVVPSTGKPGSQATTHNPL